MFTIILAVLDAYALNPDFQPELLYVGTILVDLSLIDYFSDRLDKD